MAIVAATRALPAARAAMPAVRALLVTFLGVEMVETIWEQIFNALNGITGDLDDKKGGPRGVALIDLSTGLVLGRTSRVSALMHLAARRCSRYKRPRRPIIINSGHVGKVDGVTVVN